ncbi:CDP-alcohol phosphatidyltransferase family protein [Candidatus Borrarchaeum sp.]|uniref:CDP-alcohol phosphatidyltransferase family protein n=1 Tax=Candidatus Borrarchaeum sp. TaxID=2846742 RepID=UPI00257AC9DF|nr:CDP-alcohol phosphatidyltransferase family protein [Candidatus Borrarchaeum sp.]
MELTSLLGRFKQITEKVFKPFAKILADLGLRPNHLTVIAFILSVLTAYLILVHDFAWAAVTLLAAGGCDLLDGLVARITNTVTIRGGFLDSVFDRYSDAVIIGAITFSGNCDPIWGVLAIFGSLLVSYVRARAEVAGAKLSGIGLAERPERLAIIAFFSFFNYSIHHELFNTVNYIDLFNAQGDILIRISMLTYGLNFGMIILTILTQITLLQRIWYAWKHLSGEPISHEKESS